MNISTTVARFSSKGLLLVIFCLSLTASCSQAVRGPGGSSRSSSGSGNVFDDYMNTDFAAADGFDFPFGNGDSGGAYQDKATGKRF